MADKKAGCANMDLMKSKPSGGTPSIINPASSASNRVAEMAHFEKEVDVDHSEIYLMIMHFLSSGPCQRTFGQLWNELLEHNLLPRRYHAAFSRNGAHSGIDDDDRMSLPLNYNKLVDRYPHIEKDHLVKLMKQLLRYKAYSMDDLVGAKRLSAADVPTLLGSGSFSLLDSDQQTKPLPAYLHWPHKEADQVHGLSLREIGGGFSKHHRAPSMRAACYAIAKPSTMVQKMQNIKRLRGHRNAVYCAIFDRSGRYVITGSDDRLVKIWSMETAFCLASCRGHEGDITDLAVSSNNALVASAANDFVIRVWRLPDGYPISVLRGHTAAVTAIAFSPRPNCPFQLLSSSDDGSCRIWDARSSQCCPRVYVPKPLEFVAGRSNGTASNGSSSVNLLSSNQILCCAYNANGTVFVTGSSDTYARVWNAFKSNADDSDEPIHEMDLLSGHENDVNYVQFSDCAVASRSSISDTLKEDNFPRFKNSGLCHDNIVTCSRDGSAIIWIPSSRKSNVKSWRWTKSYHLKVPPPPLPPQPPRGGPRQRILPTPRGVNMIVWSLDNRFVLAAIMDCRICVWNAVDGSLVHSLTGHTESSYVLDVHPFNPRIAMSAGYDGQTIVWDIWEGTPIRTYKIGRFKLVDGKFSPDGTSIVLSDDVGQIYLLNTGQGDAQKDAKYDQFFLGDYRPLIRDTSGHVLDQETQLSPYRRNIQEPICDSSFIPYPEPYQTMFQKRRLGAIGVEWRPSSMKFAIGPDISFGEDYQMPPLEDLDRMIEPLPEFLDGLYWEPENEVISDDNDSEYDVAEECASEGEQGSLHHISSSDPDCSAEDSDVEHCQNDSIRRSRRTKHKIEVELITPSKRHTKKRNLAETGCSTSGTSRIKKLKNISKVSTRKSSFSKSSRPQRVAARNALNRFSRIDETSTDGDDPDGSEGDASNSETELPETNMGSGDSDRYIQILQDKHDIEDMFKPSDLSQPESNGKRRKLVLKISLRDIKKSDSSEDKGLNGESHSDPAGPSLILPQEIRSEVSSRKQESSSTGVCDIAMIEDQQGTTNIADRRHYETVEDQIEQLGGEDMGEVKVQSHEVSCFRDVVLGGTSVGRATSSVAQSENWIDLNEDGEQLTSTVYQEVARVQHNGPSDGTHSSLLLHSPLLANSESKHGGSVSTCLEDDSKGERDWSGSEQQRNSDSEQLDEVSNTFDQSQLKENPPSKVVRLKIRTGGSLKKPASPSKMKFTGAGDDFTGDGGNTTLKNGSHLKQNETLGLPDKVDGSSRLMSHDVRHRDKSREFTRFDLEEVDDVEEGNTLNRQNGWSTKTGLEAAIGGTHRLRVTSTSAPSTEPNAVNSNFRVKVDGTSAGTSRDAGKKVISEDRTPSLTLTIKSKNCGSGVGGYVNMTGRKSDLPVRKLSWLLLSRHDDGYRYIPQKGDEVAYLRQGHQEYIESVASREKGPWRMVKGPLRAVEICRVESLAYAQVASGDSCCKIQLRFIDQSCCACGKSFELTLPELVNFPDFIVEKTRYDVAISRNWTSGEQCMVWWRNENGEDGDWWDGTITSSKAKSDKFPDSPWERYLILYETDNVEEHRHSPWELHDPGISWEHPHIDDEITEKLLSAFAKLEQSISRKKDYFGFGKLCEASCKPDYFNRFSVPLCPEIIISRLENNYYRTLDAFKHDIDVMIDIAKTHFARNSELSSKMDRLSTYFRRQLISDL